LVGTFFAGSRLIFLFLPSTDLIDVILETGSFSEPNNSGRWCSTGQNIQVNRRGFQKATFGEKSRNTSCTVEKKPEVKKGQTIIWSEQKSDGVGLNDCADTVFDFSRGAIDKPEVQLMTSSQEYLYCPKLVQLEFQGTDSKKHVFCVKMSGYYKMFKNDGRNNEKIHRTTEGECGCPEGYSGTQCQSQDYST
jgi:hypothetical protein